MFCSQCAFRLISGRNVHVFADRRKPHIKKLIRLDFALRLPILGGDPKSRNCKISGLVEDSGYLSASDFVVGKGL